MKVWVALSALAVLGALFAAPRPAPADTGDGLCPRSLPKVEAFTSAGRSNDPEKIAEAARGAADAFRLCMTDARISGPIEPVYNYDEMRAAYFEAVEGRALVVLGKPADAVVAFKEARSLANEIAVWTPDSNLWSGNNITGTASGRNTDRRPSQYQDAAIQIRTVAESELKKLGESTDGTPAPVSRPQAAAPTPAPH